MQATTWLTHFREQFGNHTVMSVVTLFDAPPNNLQRGMRMLLATASITAISTPALAFLREEHT
jgi:hypothetical protein